MKKRGSWAVGMNTNSPFKGLCAYFIDFHRRYSILFQMRTSDISHIAEQYLNGHIQAERKGRGILGPREVINQYVSEAKANWTAKSKAEIDADSLSLLEKMLKAVLLLPSAVRFKISLIFIGKFGLILFVAAFFLFFHFSTTASALKEEK